MRPFKRTIAHYAAWLAVRYLYRIEFAAKTPPETFLVLPAVSAEDSSLPRHRPTQTGNTSRLMFVSRRCSKYPMENQSVRQMQD